MNMVIRILLIFSLIYFCTSCVDDCKDDHDIDLILYAEIYPLKDTFDLGDTIYIKGEFNHLIEDTYGDSHLIQNYEFPTSIGFRRIQNNVFTEIDFNNSQIVDSNVEALIYNVQSVESSMILIDSLLYENSTYKFRVGLQLDFPGLFVIETGSDLELYRDNPPDIIQDECFNEELTARYWRTNVIPDSFYNYYMISEAERYSNFTPQRFQEGSNYAFYVKE